MGLDKKERVCYHIPSMIIHRKASIILAEKLQQLYAYITNLIKKDLLPGNRICRASGKVETSRSIKFTLLRVDYINDLLFSTSRSFMFSYVI
jgi:hypothetical protein